MAASEKIVLHAKDLLSNKGGIVATKEIFELIISSLVISSTNASEDEIRTLLTPIVNLLPYENASQELGELELYQALHSTFDNFVAFDFTGSAEDLQRVLSQLKPSTLLDRLMSQAKVSSKLSSLTYFDSFIKLSNELSTVHRVQSSLQTKTSFDYLFATDLDGNFGVRTLSDGGFAKLIEGQPANCNTFHLPNSDRTFFSGVYSRNGQVGNYENCLMEIFDDGTVKNRGENLEDWPSFPVLYDARGIVGDGGVLLTSGSSDRDGPVYSISKDAINVLRKAGISPFVKYADKSLEVVVREVGDRITEQKLEAIDGLNGETLLFDGKTLILSDSDGTEIDRCTCTDLNSIDEVFAGILAQNERRKYLSTYLLIAYDEREKEKES